MQQQRRCTDCPEHSGVESDLDHDKESIKEIWKAINAMRAWVVAGMGSMVAYFLVIAGDKIFTTVSR